MPHGAWHRHTACVSPTYPQFAMWWPAGCQLGCPWPPAPGAWQAGLRCLLASTAWAAAAAVVSAGQRLLKAGLQLQQLQPVVEADQLLGRGPMVLGHCSIGEPLQGLGRVGDNKEQLEILTRWLPSSTELSCSYVTSVVTNSFMATGDLPWDSVSACIWYLCGISLF